MVPKPRGSSNRVGVGIGFPRWGGAHPRKQSRVHDLIEEGLVDSSIVCLDKVRDYPHAEARGMLRPVRRLANVVVKNRTKINAWIDHPIANRKPWPEWA